MKQFCAFKLGSKRSNFQIELFKRQDEELLWIQRLKYSQQVQIPVSFQIIHILPQPIYYNTTKMKTIWKQSITVLLLISVTLTSIIPSSKTIQTLDINMPANCLKSNNNNKCLLCEKNYQLQYGLCIQSESNQSQMNNSSLSPPCGDLDSCGQALNFKSELQLKMFLSKYTQPPTQPSTQSVIGNQQNINTNANTNTYTSTYLQRMMRNVNFNLASNPMKLDFSTNGATSSNIGATINQNRIYSKTNNQIAGVDEADLIKTDGTYIYTISNSVLSILIGYPYDRSRLLSELNLQDFRPSAIFVQGDVLAVFGVKETVIQKPNFDQSGIGSLEIPTLQTKSQTHIRIYDIENRIYPILKNQIIISGSYFNGRKLDRNGFMYLLTTQPFESQKLPWYDIGSGKTSLNFTNMFYYPTTYVKPTFINIISLDLRNITKTIKMKTVCSEAPTIIFMSEYYLYLFSSYIDNNTDFTKIKKIYVYQDYIQPFADGKIVGKVLNQFCIDQRGDFLRVVTTTNDGVVSSHVVVFNFYLQLFGVLRGIAKGQEIKATRFYGNRLYLAASTAKSPFFVISLLYPKRPTILGQVRIQGFPNYLQLYDEQTVIGLGQQKNINNQQLGLKISIFNVSDVRNPRETTTFQLDQIYANSIAQTEHKAFLLSKAKNLLVIPSYLQSETVIFNGAFIFYINSSSIQLKAASNHILNQKDEFSNRYVQRSLYIQDHIYTKSKCLMKLNKIGGKYEGLRNIVIPCVPKEQIITQTLQIASKPLIISK